MYEDTVVYTTEHNPYVHVVQLRDENGNWVDRRGTFWTKEAAISSIESNLATPYPLRVVRRLKPMDTEKGH